MEGLTVYITKFALTEGIIQAEAEYFSGTECIRVKQGRHMEALFYRGEFFANREDAVKAASGIRDQKLALLKKEVKKLEALDFS